MKDLEVHSEASPEIIEGLKIHRELPPKITQQNRYRNNFVLEGNAQGVQLKGGKTLKMTRTPLRGKSVKGRTFKEWIWVKRFPWIPWEVCRGCPPGCLPPRCSKENGPKQWIHMIPSTTESTAERGPLRQGRGGATPSHPQDYSPRPSLKTPSGSFTRAPPPCAPSLPLLKDDLGHC